MALVLALSLSGSVSQISVIVAAAALLGVIVLTLLFFAHAREVKRLREWGSQAADRLAELTREQSAIAMRAGQLAQRQAQGAKAVAVQRQGVRPRAGVTAVRSAPTSAGTAVAGLPVIGEVAPVVAATVAAPLAASAVAEPAGAAAVALAAAGLAPQREQAEEATPPAPAAAPSSSQPAAAAAAAGLAAATRTVGPSAAPPRPPRPPAPLSAAVSSESAAQIPERTAQGSEQSAQSEERAAATPSANGAHKPLPPAPRRAGGGDAPAGSRSPTIYRRERSVGRIAAVIAGIVVVVALAVLLLSSVLSKGGASKPGNAASTGASSRNASGSQGQTGAAQRSLRVIVLNATETNGLAAKVASTLKGKGYSQASALFGTPSGTYPSTVVQYAPGHQAQANAVASALSVSSSSVQPLSSSVTPLSGGAPVVVIVGGGEASQSGSGGESEAGSSESEAGGETADGGEASQAQAEPGA